MRITQYAFCYFDFLSQNVSPRSQLVERYQHVANVDNVALAAVDRSNRTILRSNDLVLHLHSFQDAQHLSLIHISTACGVRSVLG